MIQLGLTDLLSDSTTKAAIAAVSEVLPDIGMIPMQECYRKARHHFDNAMQKTKNALRGGAGSVYLSLNYYLPRI